MAAISGVNSASTIGQDYMTLMITQLQNQNPLDPMSNNDMTSQLAQISSLERLESIDKTLQAAQFDRTSELEHLSSMDSTFQKALLAVQLDEAVGMIGKTVSFIPKDAGGLPIVVPKGEDPSIAEVVETAGIFAGQIVLKAGKHTIGLDEIINVRN